MRTASVSAVKTTVSGAGRLTSQLPSDGAANDDPGKVRRIEAVPGAALRTTSKPLDGSPFTVRYFSSRSWACLRVPPALDSTKRTAGVSSSTSCSGWFTTGAVAAVPAVVGAAAAGGDAAGVVAGADEVAGAGGVTAGLGGGKICCQRMKMPAQMTIARMTRF